MTVAVNKTVDENIKNFSCRHLSRFIVLKILTLSIKIFVYQFASDQF
jgi:hypothetical protein